MQAAVKILRVLWLALMGLLAILMWFQLISGFATILYAAAVLAVVITEQVLRHRLTSP